MEAAGEEGRGVGGVQVGVVAEESGDAVVALPEVQLAVVADGGGCHHDRPDGQVSQAGLGRLRLEHEEHVEQGGAPLPCLFRDDLDRHMGAAVRVQTGVPDRMEHLTDCTGTGGVGAQREHGRKGAYGARRTVAFAGGDGGSDSDVRVTGRPRESQVEGGEQHHEGGHSGAVGHVLDAAHQLGLHGDTDMVGAEAPTALPGSVRGQRERWGVRQAVPPGSEVGGVGGGGYRGQRRGRAEGPAGVQGAEFREEHAQ